MKFSPSEQDESAVVNALYGIISDAVRLRLRSDVPLEAFRSGGIDSSVVASIMSRHSPGPIKTVTVGFEEEDEHVRMRRLFAEQLRTDYRE